MTAIRFAYTSDLTYVARGARSVSQHAIAGQIEIDIPDYASGDAPVALTLTANGSPLPSAKRRLVEGRLFRAFNGPLVGDGSLAGFAQTMDDPANVRALANLDQPRFTVTLPYRPFVRRIDADTSLVVEEKIKAAAEKFCFIDGQLHRRSAPPVIQVSMTQQTGIRYVLANTNDGLAARKMLSFSAERLDVMREFREQVIRSIIKNPTGPFQPDGFACELQLQPDWAPFPETFANTRCLFAQILSLSPAHFSDPDLRRLRTEPDPYQASFWAQDVLDYARGKGVSILSHPLADLTNAAVAAIEWSGDFLSPSRDPDLANLSL
ncbi:hypothetical protein [Bosea sp. RAC05]|uniref:hypothetical protein n=1 Tax=Bosea sp. RAC05 TaxID=1842539 RepID=UPI00083D23A0|nr:hypothetical protein [Bosea sp. RAC05]AOG02920.1 hypothetical protein BSY19_5318 [Bosea sp. RAC05]